MAGDIELLSPAGVAVPGGHYSHAVAANGFLFIAGELPITPDGTRLTAADFATQTRQVLANLDAILAAKNLTRARLVSVRVYVTRVADWPEFNALYAAWIGPHRPARAVVPVPELHFGLRLEIEAVAAL
jgi:reactive intermediate/imine deaminase